MDKAVYFKKCVEKAACLRPTLKNVLKIEIVVSSTLKNVLKRGVRRRLL